jgi:hypothetical protein
VKFPPPKKYAKCSRCGLTAADLKDGACPEEARCKAVAGGVSLGGPDFPTTVAGVLVASALPKKPERKVPRDPKPLMTPRRAQWMRFEIRHAAIVAAQERRKKLRASPSSKR